MHIDDFGMDTITLAGDLRAKLRAVREAGFGQIMLSARDLVGHPEGWRAAVRDVQSSGLRVTGFQVLRDFEGLSGHLHDYKVDIAKGMLEMCHALGAKVLLACSSTSQHASADPDDLARDLRKLATLAVKAGMQITELSAAELARFREKVKPVIDKHTQSVGAETVAALNAELAKVRR